MARFKLRPLFGRTRTSTSIASEAESTASTAIDDSITQLKKSTPSLPQSPALSAADHSLPPPTPDLGTRLASLGSVGEEQTQELDDSSNVRHLMTSLRPSLVLQEPTPPNSENPLSTQLPHIRSPLISDTIFEPDTLTADEAPATRNSSSASPRHISRPDSIVDSHVPPAVRSSMPRKIWVKRPGASATLVQVKEDDLVDDVREMILRKYANSLGKTFDAPDMTLRIFARPEPSHGRSDRVLGPEEDICSTIDRLYPGGQTVDDALVIDVPTRRTPKPSPRPHYAAYGALDDFRPVETGTDYFPPMPAMQPVLPNAEPRSMSVLTTGQLPQLPSPGSAYKQRHGHRPRIGRQHTSSPTLVQTALPPAPNQVHRLSTRPRVDSSASESHQAIPLPPPVIPTPPLPDASKAPTVSTPPTPTTTATSTLSARTVRPKKPRKTTPDRIGRRRDRRPSTDLPSMAGMPSISSILDGNVPPINVLIVEDNSINLRVLEGLMKRLRVRWDSATNGQIAVNKWRKGGYHLILMDIQMPVMNGIQATKEIRRLEKVNGIGVFSGSTPSSPEEVREARQAVPEAARAKDDEIDKITVTDGTLKSPIIIVALTASSLQSDRHEALAAGCNDFLTKPVNMGWLERKVKEWGCMQALIDFDGWKRWRDINEQAEAGKSEEKKAQEREKEERMRVKMEKLTMLQEKRKVEEAERKRQKSMDKANAVPAAA